MKSADPSGKKSCQDQAGGPEVAHMAQGDGGQCQPCFQTQVLGNNDGQGIAAEAP